MAGNEIYISGTPLKEGKEVMGFYVAFIEIESRNWE